MITPSTTITLYDCPLTADQENQIRWTNSADQVEWFNSLTKRSFTGSSYQRDKRAIRLPVNIEELRHFNYCSYTNYNYTPKTIYAFVTELEYINDNVTLAYIETDVWQTWWGFFDFVESFVEREHVRDDTIGLHTYPEAIEYGPYICSSVVDINSAKRALQFFCMQVTDLPNGHGISNSDLPNRVYNGMPSGCYYLCFERGQWAGMNRWLKAYADDGKIDAILSIFPITRDLVGGVNQNGIALPPSSVNNAIFSGTYIIPDSDVPVYIEATGPTIPRTIDGYTPKNNKLFTAPYCYFNYMSMTGSTIAFDFEDFNGSPNFRLDGAVTTGGEFKLYPLNYKNSTDANHPNGGYAFGVDVPSFPQGSWSSDSFLNWRALNSDAISIQTQTTLAKDALAGVGSILSLNLASAVTGVAGAAIDAASTIALANNQIRVASLTPDQARGDTATKTLTFANEKSFGAFYTMTIKYEYARIVDDYFSMYGYKVNRLQRPQFWSRKNWNYIKTIGCNIRGEVPQEDILKMKQIMDRGITFWHNPATFLDYTQDNSIKSN